MKLKREPTRPMDGGAELAIFTLFFPTYRRIDSNHVDYRCSSYL